MMERKRRLTADGRSEGSEGQEDFFSIKHDSPAILWRRRRPSELDKWR